MRRFGQECPLVVVTAGMWTVGERVWLSLCLVVVGMAVGNVWAPSRVALLQGGVWVRFACQFSIFQRIGVLVGGRRWESGLSRL